MMPWSGWVFHWFVPNDSTTIADQAAALFEDRAWGLVERRMMWLSHRELRGYMRARTRPLLHEIVSEVPSARKAMQNNPRFHEIINDRLVERLLRRAEMARSHSQLRQAA